MMYEEKMEIRRQISQLLADNGLNRENIREIIEQEISKKVNQVVDDEIKSLNAQCSSGEWIKESIRKHMENNYINSYAFRNVLLEELRNRVIDITLRDVNLSENNNGDDKS